MANDNVCVFCGEKPGFFQGDSIVVGGTTQVCCTACKKEISGQKLSEIELCRRALKLGRAQNAEKLEARIELITHAEEARPKCLRCGAPMKYGRLLSLDDSPLRDSLFSSTFDVVPLYCTTCGKVEFYDPAVIRSNDKLSYLYQTDAP